MSETPEALLKSALEKIVYFEARSTQLSNDAGRANDEIERLRADLASAAQREIELRRVIAELQVRASRAHAEREDAARVSESLRRERAELIGKMLDASRIQRSGEEVEDLDLAQFIAELRSEVVHRREAVDGDGDAASTARLEASLQTPSPQGADSGAGHSTRGRFDVGLRQSAGTMPQGDVASTAGPNGVATVAHELRAQGRLHVSAQQMAELGGAQTFPGRSEETLFGFSVRELSAIDPQARVRAAERLKALAHPAAAPALATALNAETEPVALVAMLGALSLLAHGEAVPVVQPHLTSPSPDVRIAALKALLVLDATHAGPHLAAAMKDPDPAVRRRASLLALGLTGAAALSLGEQAIRDPVADVRSLAALVLGASGAETARSSLLEAMRDTDARVRRSASQAMSSLLGRDVTGLVSLDAAQRRREVRRLVNEPAKPVMAKQGVVGLRSTVMAAPMVQPMLQRAPAAVVPQKKKSAVAVLEVESRPAPAVASSAAGLGAEVLRELRSSIRGRPIDELSAGVRASAAETLEALSSLLAQGQVVRRGHKYFVA